VTYLDLSTHLISRIGSETALTTRSLKTPANTDLLVELLCPAIRFSEPLPTVTLSGFWVKQPLMMFHTALLLPNFSFAIRFAIKCPKNAPRLLRCRPDGNFFGD
jgi:hypothetical protein